MNALGKVLGFLKPYRRQVLLAFVLTIAFTVLTLSPPMLMRYFFDKVVEPQAWHLLAGIVLAITMAPILSATVRFGNVWVIMYLGRRVVADIRLAMYSKAMNLDMGYHAKTSGGALVAKLMDDVNRIQRLVTEDTIRIVVDIVVFVFSMVFVTIVSPVLAGILCLFVALYVLVYRIFSRRIHRAARAFRNTYDVIAGRLSETITGVRQVRIYNREELETALFLQRTARSLDSEVSSRINSLSLGVACQAISGVGSTALVALGAYYVLHGKLKYGDLHAVNSYIWMAISPAIRLTTMMGQLAETRVSVDRIADVLTAESNLETPPDAPLMQRGDGAVEFRDIAFRYDPDVPLYEGLSLDIQPGQTVALVGPTGCGKTTLVSLLMRHWDVQAGAICIDGVDIRSVNLKSLRRLFGVVGQEPLVFEGTLAENIAYGRPEATEEQIEQAGRAAEIHEMAMALPDGYTTVLGSDGVRLSVGERQRVSIARAILTDPGILILDEATSSLDSRSEALIQAALNRVLRTRTSFVVAHRLSTITGADKIVVMRDGTIVETGRHEELLANDAGLYRKLYAEMLGQQAEGGQS